VKNFKNFRATYLRGKQKFFRLCYNVKNFMEVFEMLKKIFCVMLMAFTFILVDGENNSTEAGRAAHTWATVVRCNEWISLREYPSTQAPRLAKIPLGTRLKIYYERGSENGFYYAFYQEGGRYGEYGWVLASYLSFD